MFLYDTNIISELLKVNPDSNVVAFNRTAAHIYFSVITVDEMFYGLRARPSPKTMRSVEKILASQSVTVLPVVQEIAKLSGELRGFFRAQGKTRSQADMLIAATAQIHRLTVVTRNTKDFEGCGIPIVNPFL